MIVSEQLLLFSRYQRFPATHFQDLLKFRSNFGNFQDMSRVISSLVKKTHAWSFCMNLVRQNCVRGSFLKLSGVITEVHLNPVKHLRYFNVVLLFQSCTTWCCTIFIFHYLMLDYLMLHYLMLHYLMLYSLILRYLMLHYFNIALFDVALFWCSTCIM